MYCLYKNSNVVWQGNRVTPQLNKMLGVTLSPDAFRRTSEEVLAEFEIYNNRTNLI